MSRLSLEFLFLSAVVLDAIRASATKTFSYATMRISFPTRTNENSAVETTANDLCNPALHRCDCVIPLFFRLRKSFPRAFLSLSFSFRASSYPSPRKSCPLLLSSGYPELFKFIFSRVVLLLLLRFSRRTRHRDFSSFSRFLAGGANFTLGTL